MREIGRKGRPGSPHPRPRSRPREWGDQRPALGPDAAEVALAQMFCLPLNLSSTGHAFLHSASGVSVAFWRTFAAPSVCDWRPTSRPGAGCRASTYVDVAVRVGLWASKNYSAIRPVPPAAHAVDCRMRSPPARASAVHAAASHRDGRNLRLFLGGRSPPNPSRGRGCGETRFPHTPARGRVWEGCALPGTTLLLSHRCAAQPRRRRSPAQAGVASGSQRREPPGERGE